MVHYIETSGTTNKALWLVEHHAGQLINRETALLVVETYPSHDRGIVVVMDNGPFQAAGFAYDLDEFTEFADPSDPRSRQYVEMNRTLAAKLSHYEGKEQ